MCILKFLIGITMIVGGILLEISWLALCFGSVIVGIVLLLFAPYILFLPFTVGVYGGLAIIASCYK